MRALIVGFLAVASGLLAQSDIVVIQGARVVDGTGAPAKAANVRIRGGRIEAVGADVTVPAGARVVEAAGKTLIPGIFDLHTHLSASAVNGAPADWGKILKAYLAAGVTTVNDYATYGEMFEPMRRLLASGGFPGPRVNMAVRMSTTGGHGTEGGWGDAMTLEANTVEQAHARMKTVIAYKPGVIKVFTDGWRYGTTADLTSMNLETLSAIVADAHAANLKVVTHTVTLNGAKIAARAKVDVLVHGIGDTVADQELADLMKANGTAYASTLAVYENKTQPAAPRVLTLLDSAARALVARPAERTPSVSPARARRWQNLLSNVRQLHRSGVAIAAGTDAGMTGTYHGYASLHELELLVEAGLTPLQAISAGTGVSARAIGATDRGTIEPGKLADLVLIDGRPDEKIADIVKTGRVFLGGVEYDPRKLEAEIQSDVPTPMPLRTATVAVDNMEHASRTELGTLRVNSTDAGIDHSQMIFQPVVRSGQDHALLVTARLAAKDRPYVRLELPLAPGGVEAVDVSPHKGVSFDVRGNAAARFLMYVPRSAARGGPAAPFTASTDWQTVKIPLDALQNPRAARALAFELSGKPESTVWLELDNVRFY